MGTAAVSHLKLLIPKLCFEAKTPVFTPFLYRSTNLPIFFNVVEVSACFWTVPGQSRAELPIFIALHNHLTNRNIFFSMNEVF